MKLKNLTKKIRRLEARLLKDTKKLVKLKNKLLARPAAAARKARKKSSASQSRPTAKSSPPPAEKTSGTKAAVKTKGKGAKRSRKKRKRKLNLSPERRAELAAAMKARWAAKRAATAKTSSTGRDSTAGPAPPMP
jgi:hypothetical protein